MAVTNSSCPFKGDVRLTESQLKDVKKGSEHF